MSAASDLIERMEKETGQRVDHNDGDNFAVAGLLGALSRVMDQSKFDERDGVAVGVTLKHQISPVGQREKESNALIASMLRSGLSPDDVKLLLD